MSPEDSPARLSATGLLVPGATVFVVLHKDPLRERIDVRVSRVLDLEEGAAAEGVLFLAQTEPPVPLELRGATLEIAVLSPAVRRPRRPVGYVARLLDLREDFPQPGQDVSVQALAVSAPGPDDLFETSLRMHHRVPVDPDMGVVLQLGGGLRVALLDFSAAGARALVSPAQDDPPPAPPPLFEEPEPDSELADAAPAQAAPVQAEALQAAPVQAEALQAEALQAEALQAEPVQAESVQAEPQVKPQAKPVRFDVGQSLPFRLLFLGSGFAEGDAVVRSARPAEDGVSAILGLCFTNMEIRDIRYLERMVARTVSACRQRERDAEYE